ncbi:thioredoxin family protein [Dorcoceras hygrometricum]|uniref:Thioredoxin family protein n=1 Tax=Dorcoceras hygrometricum TaxID=472368 RepID=A0A2Z7BL90_9LAMI|nr:thioredoxin family protein [Dorcoceras hygrometricum]
MTVLPLNIESSTCVTLNGSGIQLAVGPQPLWLRNHNSGLTHRIMVKRLATSPHNPLGITDSACKNQLVVVSVQYGPFNPYIPIRSTTIGKSRVAIDPIAMHTSWRSNSDITSVTSIGYPRMSANGESSTTMLRLLHASGSHPIPMPYDPNAHVLKGLYIARAEHNQRHARTRETRKEEECSANDSEKYQVDSTSSGKTLINQLGQEHFPVCEIIFERLSIH